MTDAINIYFSFLTEKISKDNVNSKTNIEKIPTFHHYLEQNNVQPPPSLVIKTFPTKEITSIIKTLKTKNSHGFVEVCTKLLKISVTYICSPLTYIPYFSDHKTHFFLEKCDLNSTCVL